MKERKDWLILDLQTNKALYGFNQKTMVFSTKEVAQEVAEQLFGNKERFAIINIVLDLKLNVL